MRCGESGQVIDPTQKVYVDAVRDFPIANFDRQSPIILMGCDR